MARKKASNPAFVKYEKFIVANPAYAGMPDVYGADGGIQWEAPSNRGKGQFQFTHDRRLAWWKSKAKKLGISTDEKAWISKVAKRIHPTKKKPCAVCGRIMDIRYCYLNYGFISALEKKLSYISHEDIEYNECTSIFDFIVNFADIYGEEQLSDLAAVLKCKAVKNVPIEELGSDVTKWLGWIEKEYIPKEPSRLSPGSMSNAPDRFDGFHTYNRCCRTTQDSGRSKENLQSYTTDRRVYEFWVDGNWITANKAMGIIRKEAEIQSKPCYNEINDGTPHSKPITADHIGPISLGFCHRPVFRLLCQSCNSQKNNRMYLADVNQLKQFEQDGQAIVSWYAKPIWDSLKNNVRTPEDALKLSRVMRDNRFNALFLLNRMYCTCRASAFMLSLLHLENADYNYRVIRPWRIENSVISFDFSENHTELEYATIQKIRRIRIGFDSLKEYSEKENRNGLLLWNEHYDSMIEDVTQRLTEDVELSEVNIELNQALEDPYEEEGKLRQLFEENKIPSPETFRENDSCLRAKSVLEQVMNSIAQELTSKWNDPRYSRD